MKQQEILRKIGGIIAELKEQHTYLEANGSSFNDLELELFMANANFLTDYIEILKKIYVQAKPAAAIVETPERLYPTKPIILDYFSEEAHLPFADDPLVKKLNDTASVQNPELEQAQFFEQEPELAETFSVPEAQPEMEEPAPFMIADTSFTAQKSVSPETEEAEHIVAEAEVEPVEVVGTQPEIEHQESPKPELFFAEEAKPEPVKPEPIPQAFIKPEPVKPEPEPVLTLNQRIAAQKGLEQPTAKMGFAGKSTQDLPALISLNDKLLFIKELFNGYNLAYSEAINILNRYTNFEQAEQFLKANYAGKNNWKDKPATLERFYDLLRKRFS